LPLKVENLPRSRVKRVQKGEEAEEGDECTLY
jgi:hypothetical protein